MEYNRKHILKRLPALFIALFSIVICSSSVAQTITADSTRFPIGGKINLNIEVPLEQGVFVSWPAMKDTITRSIEILSQSKIDTVDNVGGGKLLKQIISITSFDTGFIVMPPLKFEVVKDGTPVRTMNTQPMLFEVYKVAVDLTSEIKDIKPIIKAPITFDEIIPWLALLLLSGIIIYLVLYYLKKRKKVSTIEKPKIKALVPAWEIAIQKLDILKSEKIWERGDIKEYYTRLTDILREYFEIRFNVNASEMTSSEILEAMKLHIKDERAFASLRELLTLSDMAKFAKAQPGAFENEQSIKYGYEIVKFTSPQVKEPNVNNS